MAMNTIQITITYAIFLAIVFCLMFCYTKMLTKRNQRERDEKESFELLQDILDMAGELSKRAPYDDLVNTEYALKAAE